jgi:capsid protein
MNLLKQIGKAFAAGYDAVKSTGKRKAATPVTKSEDEQLKGRDRSAAIGGSRDIVRNFGLVQWAIRRHLDYVTKFDFQSRTGDDAFDMQLEGLMREWCKPGNCDVSGRHSFKRLIRLAEARRVIDGDVFLMKRSSGKIQPVEGDLIQTRDGDENKYTNGAILNSDGKVLSWALHKRMKGTGRKMFVRDVRAKNMLQHAQFDRFDQVRGVSPILSALNQFRDVYEGIDSALAKMKVEQLFALVITSQADVGLGDHTQTNAGYDVDFGKGPIKLELDPGDAADFLKTDNPGSNTREFIDSVIAISLKALDIPFNFYDEAHTNFFGSRAAWLLYDRACDAKREEVLEILNAITRWKIMLWVMDGDLRLPQGLTAQTVPFEWVHRGMPWWDPAKEIRGHVEAISAGLTTPQRVCRESGQGEYEDNIKQIAKAQEIAAEMTQCQQCCRQRLLTMTWASTQGRPVLMDPLCGELTSVQPVRTRSVVFSSPCHRPIAMVRPSQSGVTQGC